MLVTVNKHVKVRVYIRASMPVNNSVLITVHGPVVHPVVRDVLTHVHRIVTRIALLRPEVKDVPVVRTLVLPTVSVVVAETSVVLNHMVHAITTAELVVLERVVHPCVCNSVPTSVHLVYRHADSNVVLVVLFVVLVVKLHVISTVQKSVQTAVPITVSTTVLINAVVVVISAILVLVCVLVSVLSSVNKAVPTALICAHGGVTLPVVQVAIPIVLNSV